MELCVSNVLTVKNGMRRIWVVHVILAIDGMDNFVKNHSFVQMEEYGIQRINNVFALMDHIGVDMLVYQLKNVMVDNILIQLFKNVHVLQVITGMVKFVYNATTEELGILQLWAAHAQSELLKWKMDVDSNKRVLEVNNGVKILGLVNVHQVQFGMAISV
jgi:hypothetical protein